MQMDILHKESADSRKRIQWLDLWEVWGSFFYIRKV